jgi:hypothetical protein
MSLPMTAEDSLYLYQAELLMGSMMDVSIRRQQGLMEGFHQKDKLGFEGHFHH